MEANIALVTGTPEAPKKARPSRIWRETPITTLGRASPPAGSSYRLLPDLQHQAKAPPAHNAHVNSRRAIVSIRRPGFTGHACHSCCGHTDGGMARVEEAAWVEYPG